MEEKEILFSIEHEIVICIAETTDSEMLDRYKKILSYLLILIGGREKWK